MVISIIFIKILDQRILLSAFHIGGQEEYISIDAYERNNLSYIHPFYSPYFFCPIGLRIPPALILNPTFHLIGTFLPQGLVLVAFLLPFIILSPCTSYHYTTHMKIIKG